MSAAQVMGSRYPHWRTLLVLGRVSNLPTVWSNCLAGWVLSGGGTAGRFLLLCLAASALYVGGMFLNDAFDAEFDRQYRKERPIPSGAISASGVWGWGLGWLFGGWLLLTLLGWKTASVGLVLLGTILLYDAIHKAITLSPLLMALCRFLLYLLSGAATHHRVAGWTVWSGLVLALYVVGLSYIARKESARGPLQLWPPWLLGAPFLLAWIVNSDGYRGPAALQAVLLAGWIAYCLRSSYWMETVSIGRTVSGLLAGICLVDLLAVGAGHPGATLSFLALFGLSLLGQRFVPAT